MILQLQDVGYVYPSAFSAAVEGVELGLLAGERVLLTGPTGCGKSTLLRLCAGLLQRHGQGEVFGEVLLRGRDPARLPPAERAQGIGWVAQDPVAQIITGTVGDELSFPLEVLDLDVGEMAQRLRLALAQVGLDELGLERSTDALSGGQRQRLALAAALVGGAQLLLLDEPLAQVDPAAAVELVALLDDVASQGVAIVVVEHRLEALWHWADRLLVLESGKPVFTGVPASAPLPALRRMGLTLPGVLDAEERLGRSLASIPQTPSPQPPPARAGSDGEVVLEASQLAFTYPGSAVPALVDVSVTLRRGEQVAIIGTNGSGKSTLLACLAGHLDGGAVTVAGRVVDVPQDPDLALFCETVREELEHGPVEARLSRAEVVTRRDAAAGALSLERLLDRPPQALSRGQRLRTAVAAALTCHPELLLLDEPTAGQDAVQVERMMQALRDRSSLAVVFATHDVGLALRHADRWWVVHDGRLVLDVPVERALQSLPDEVPLVLPALARWCVERGWPVLSPEALVASLGVD